VTEHRVCAQLLIDVRVAFRREVSASEARDGEFGGKAGIKQCPPIILAGAQ